jgi:drug/metabolite transporter (DMT)-like permease
MYKTRQANAATIVRVKPDDGARTTGAGPYLYLLVTMALFAGAFTSSKVVVGQVPHDVAAALRFGGGAVILVLLLCSRRGTGKFSWRELAVAGSVGLVGVFAYNFFFFWGLSLAPAIDGSIIVPVLSPVLTTVVFLVTGKETASLPRVGGLVLGVAGAVVFFAGIGAAGSGLTGSRLLGDLIYLLGAGCWAAYSIASKKVLAGMQPLRATTYATGVGALALILVSIPSLSHVDWTGLSGKTWANVAFLAIGPTAIAYLFYYRGLRSVSPVTATVTMFTVPVLSSISSSVFLGESFTGIQLVGALITIAGALLAVTRSRRSSGARPEKAGHSRTRRSGKPQRVPPAADTGRTG